jgi:hypothetical protein
MLLYTEQNAHLHDIQGQKELQRSQLATWVANAEENCKYLSDQDTDPTFAPKRIGQPLHHDVLEKRLKALNPAIVSIWNGFNSSKKCLYYGDTHIPYEAGVMPERSIMGRKEEKVPVANICDTKFVLERKEIKSDGKNPWMKTIQVPWREEVRGWRTVLIKLVACQAITPTQAEVMFSPADNAAWQGGMGKAKVTGPF